MSVRGDAGIDIEMGRCLGVALGIRLAAPKAAAASSSVMKSDSVLKSDSGEVSNMVRPISFPFWLSSAEEAEGVDGSPKEFKVTATGLDPSACASGSSCENLQSSPSLQCPFRYEGQVGPKLCH
jgi:hypothetical protein